MCFFLTFVTFGLFSSIIFLFVEDIRSKKKKKKKEKEKRKKNGKERKGKERKRKKLKKKKKYEMTKSNKSYVRLSESKGKRNHSKVSIKQQSTTERKTKKSKANSPDRTFTSSKTPKLSTSTMSTNKKYNQTKTRSSPPTKTRSPPPTKIQIGEVVPWTSSEINVKEMQLNSPSTKNEFDKLSHELLLNHKKIESSVGLQQYCEFVLKTATTINKYTFLCAIIFVFSSPLYLNNLIKHQKFGNVYENVFQKLLGSFQNKFMKNNGVEKNSNGTTTTTTTTTNINNNNNNNNSISLYIAENIKRHIDPILYNKLLVLFRQITIPSLIGISFILLRKISLSSPTKPKREEKYVHDETIKLIKILILCTLDYDAPGVFLTNQESNIITAEIHKLYEPNELNKSKESRAKLAKLLELIAAQSEAQNRAKQITAAAEERQKQTGEEKATTVIANEIATTAEKAKAVGEESTEKATTKKATKLVAEVTAAATEAAKAAKAEVTIAEAIKAEGAIAEAAIAAIVAAEAAKAPGAVIPGAVAPGAVVPGAEAEAEAVVPGAVAPGAVIAATEAEAEAEAEAVPVIMEFNAKVEALVEVVSLVKIKKEEQNEATAEGPKQTEKKTTEQRTNQTSQEKEKKKKKQDEIETKVKSSLLLPVTAQFAKELEGLLVDLIETDLKIILHKLTNLKKQQQQEKEPLKQGQQQDEQEIKDKIMLLIQPNSNVYRSIVLENVIQGITENIELLLLLPSFSNSKKNFTRLETLYSNVKLIAAENVKICCSLFKLNTKNTTQQVPQQVLNQDYLKFSQINPWALFFNVGSPSIHLSPPPK